MPVPIQRRSMHALIFLPMPKLGKSLESITLTRNPVRLALADNLLAEPFGLEAAVQHMQILNDVFAAPNDGLLGCDRAVGLDAELEGRKQWVGDLVGGEDHVVVLKEALGEEVAERVILFVECEDSGVRYACKIVLAQASTRQQANSRVSSLYSTFCWPSSSKKSSNLGRHCQNQMTHCQACSPD